MAAPIVRLGSPRAPGEALRIGTVRGAVARTSFAVGWYCESEWRCHRSILRLLLEARGAQVA